MKEIYLGVETAYMFNSKEAEKNILRIYLVNLQMDGRTRI